MTKRSLKTVALVFLVQSSASAQIRPPAQPYSTLQLSSSPAAIPVVQATGGIARGEVITQRVSASGLAKKHLGRVEIVPFHFEAHPLASKPLTQWVNQMIQGNPTSINLVQTECNRTGSATSRNEMNQGVLTEIRFPALDATGGGGAFTLGATVQPQSVRMVRSSTGNCATPGRVEVLTSSLFRMDLEGLDTTRVTRIESFKIRQAVLDDERLRGALEIPDLEITVLESHSAGFLSWYEDFVVQGNNGDDREKSGSIALQSANRRDLFRINLSHVGIHKFEKLPENESGVSKVKIGLYVESMSLESVSN